MGFAIPLTGIVVGVLNGPEAVVALGIQWAAIVGINIAYAAGRPRSWPAAGAAAIDVQPTAAELGERPAIPKLEGRLPLTIAVKVEQIRRKAEVLYEQQRRSPVGSSDTYVLQRTSGEYLPATVDAYLALAGDDRPLGPHGHTAVQALRNQLELLDAKLDEIADDLQRQNADRLLANERFLEERFGRS